VRRFDVERIRGCDREAASCRNRGTPFRNTTEQLCPGMRNGLQTLLLLETRRSAESLRDLPAEKRENANEVSGLSVVPTDSLFSSPRLLPEFRRYTP